MRTQVVTISDLHLDLEYMNWKKEILFWKDEINLTKKQLGKITNQWTNNSALGKLARFQNSFISHEEKIEELDAIVNTQQYNITRHFPLNEGTLDVFYINIHKEFRSKMKIERKKYNDLKMRFFLFLSKYT